MKWNTNMEKKYPRVSPSIAVAAAVTAFPVSNPNFPPPPPSPYRLFHCRCCLLHHWLSLHIFLSWRKNNDIKRSVQSINNNNNMRGKSLQRTSLLSRLYRRHFFSHRLPCCCGLDFSWKKDKRSVCFINNTMTEEMKNNCQCPLLVDIFPLRRHLVTTTTSPVATAFPPHPPHTPPLPLLSSPPPLHIIFW